MEATPLPEVYRQKLLDMLIADYILSNPLSLRKQLENLLLAGFSGFEGLDGNTLEAKVFDAYGHLFCDDCEDADVTLFRDWVMNFPKD